MTTNYEKLETTRVEISHQVTETICDICSRSASHKETGYFPAWPQANGQEYPPVRELNQIRSDWGFTYTEVAIKIDLCPSCFHKKLIPWLKEQGVDIDKRTRRQGGTGAEGPW